MSIFKNIKLGNSYLFCMLFYLILVLKCLHTELSPSNSHALNIHRLIILIMLSNELWSNIISCKIHNLITWVRTKIECSESRFFFMGSLEFQARDLYFDHLKSDQCCLRMKIFKDKSSTGIASGLFPRSFSDTFLFRFEGLSLFDQRVVY